MQSHMNTVILQAAVHVASNVKKNQRFRRCRKRLQKTSLSIYFLLGKNALLDFDLIREN